MEPIPPVRRDGGLQPRIDAATAAEPLRPDQQRREQQRRERAPQQYRHVQDEDFYDGELDQDAQEQQRDPDSEGDNRRAETDPDDGSGPHIDIRA